MAREVEPERGRFELRADPKEIRAWLSSAELNSQSLSEWLRSLANRESAYLEGRILDAAKRLGKKR